MPIDLSQKRIFMIHGLASKPPEADLHELWSNCLIENIRLDDAPLARAIESQPSILRHAYWANVIPHHVEDDRTYVRKLRGQVDEVIEARQQMRGNFHVGMKEKVGAFFKDRGLDLVSVFTNALTIKDNVAKAMLREVELYSEDQYIADSVRQPLEEGLREAWDEGCEVLLISHSMGSFIAYDVLWQLSHDPDLKEKYCQKKIEIWMTLGSPLGDSSIRKRLLGAKEKPMAKFPVNVIAWHNVAAEDDYTCHDNTLADDFKMMMQQRVVSAVHDHKIFNLAIRYGKSNPHSSIGYYIHPRISKILADWLQADNDQSAPKYTF